uniref:Interleukin n=1 Tax=Fundulus heteroclitus TaxID=8078 RepID=A0A3Q2PZT3_FUNHE
MKLVAFCLLAVCCSTLAAPPPSSISKLKETQKELSKFLKSLPVSKPTLLFLLLIASTTPFIALVTENMLLHLCLAEYKRYDVEYPTCMNCTDYPTESVNEFFSRLQSRLEKVRSIACF